MKAWSNSVDTVVAEDLEDVRRVLISFYGDGCDVVEMMNEGFEEVPDDHPITITNYDDRNGKLTLTARQWIERDGRGLLCSTEW